MKEFTVATLVEVETASSSSVLQRAQRESSSHGLYVGLDVHKDTVAVAVAYRGREAAHYQGEIANTPKALSKLVSKRMAHSEGEVALAQREPVKTDRRDALRLASKLGAGELGAVPDLEQEAMRELSRGRSDFKSRQHKAQASTAHGRRSVGPRRRGGAMSRFAHGGGRTPCGQAVDVGATRRACGQHLDSHIDAGERCNAMGATDQALSTLIHRLTTLRRGTTWWRDSPRNNNKYDIDEETSNNQSFDSKRAANRVVPRGRGSCEGAGSTNSGPRGPVLRRRSGRARIDGLGGEAPGISASIFSRHWTRGSCVNTRRRYA